MLKNTFFFNDLEAGLYVFGNNNVFFLRIGGRQNTAALFTWSQHCLWTAFTIHFLCGFSAFLGCRFFVKLCLQNKKMWEQISLLNYGKLCLTYKFCNLNCFSCIACQAALSASSFGLFSRLRTKMPNENISEYNFDR
mgnify:CR=1 FL=1